MTAKQHIMLALRASGPLTESQLCGELYVQCQGVDLDNVVHTANEALAELVSAGDIVFSEGGYDINYGNFTLPGELAKACGDNPNNGKTVGELVDLHGGDPSLSPETDA